MGASHLGLMSKSADAGGHVVDCVARVRYIGIDEVGFRAGSALSIRNCNCMILLNGIARTNTWPIVCGGFNIDLCRKLKFSADL